MARKASAPAPRKRLIIQSVKEVSLVGLGANQPAKVLLFKSADAPASDAAPAPADTPTATAPLSKDIASALASALSEAVAAGNVSVVKVGDIATIQITPAVPASQEKKSMADEKQTAESVDKAAELAATIKALEDKLATEKSEREKSDAERVDLAKKVADQGAVIAKAAREALVAKTVNEVKDTYKALPGVKFDELAEDVISLREKDADLAKKFEARLKAAADAIEHSPLLKTVGSVEKTKDAATAEDEYEQLVSKFHGDNPKLTREAAAAKAIESPEGKALYNRMIRTK